MNIPINPIKRLTESGDEIAEKHTSSKSTQIMNPTNNAKYFNIFFILKK